MATTMSGIDEAQTITSDNYSSSEDAEEPGIQENDGFENYETKNQRKKKEKERKEQ